jgi:phage shock protein PspC (stress-responsive transcriptional regulator)
MEKVISINFQGRVIPIEETAYNNLKRYIDSLRSHFAKEESSDEIINDIENRIAELFTDRLKRGAPCIVSSDVDAVIDSIGRLEDIEAAEGEEPKASPGADSRRQGQATATRGRLFRNEDDKVIAGVCSGLANRIGMDPVILRILFVLLFGALFWVYIILWIIVPSQSVQTSVTRRLYRNPDDKKIAGVCGGLAAYFHTSGTTVRLIFLLPLIISIISGSMHAIWWNWHFGMGPGVIFGGLGSTMLLGYIILWIAVPYAASASDKLEMRGEKVDMNTIKAARQASGDAAPVRHRSGVGQAVAVLFKAFFFFIAGIVALTMFCVLIALVFGGVAAMPYTDFFLQSGSMHMIAWVGIFLVLGIPVLSFITWGIRRMTGARTPRRNYLGYIFTVLWIAGVVCVANVVGTMIHEFNSRHAHEEVYPMSQPTANKLYVRVNDDAIGGHRFHIGWQWGDDDGDEQNEPFRIINNESLWINSVRLKVAQSPDSQFHIYKITSSRGKTEEQAKVLADHVQFNISQYDSVFTLPKGFTISKTDKFRDQKVIVVVEVPIGKGIQIDGKIRRSEWFDVHVNEKHYRMYRHSRHRYSRHYRHQRHYWIDKEYVMTPEGLKSAEDSATEDDSSNWNDEDQFN